jgi:hypothetical protein
MRFFLHKSLTGKAVNCFGVIVAERGISGVSRAKCTENKLDLEIGIKAFVRRYNENKVRLITNDDKSSCGSGMKIA